MVMVRLATEAMRTRFECVLHGANEVALRAAGEAALAEVRATERCLSRFLPDSELAQLHREAASGWSQVSAHLWEALAGCRLLHESTSGTFDPGVATPPGFRAVEFDAYARAIRFSDPRLRLDLGGVGKGIALDRAARVLLDAGVECALLHGGTSSILALGAPPGAAAWHIAIADPDDPECSVAGIALRDAALGISARARTLDPRGANPCAGPVRLAVVRARSATEADAWATAWLLLGSEPLEFRIVS